MDIKQKIEILSTYFHINRGVGHSKLLNTGVANYSSDKFVLCSTKEAGNHLRLRKSEIIGLSGLNSCTFRGHMRPLVVDNSALMVIFDETLLRIGKLEEENKKLVRKSSNSPEDYEKHIQELKEQIKKQKATSSILKSLLSSSIDKIVERDKKITEMEKYPFKTFLKSIFNHGNTGKSSS